MPVAYIDQLKQQIQEYFGSRGKISEHKTGIVDNLAKPKSIGLFFCISTGDELASIRSLLRHIKLSKENVKAYVFSLSGEHVDVITEQSIIYFDLNDFTLFGKKRDQIKSIFEKDRSELFISFLSKPDQFTYRLAAEMHAEFKVGPKLEGYTDIYDLVLDIDKQRFNYIKFYEHVRHYLTVLNIKTR
jgi:Family of unknown function (DUF6913)